MENENVSKEKQELKSQVFLILCFIALFELKYLLFKAFVVLGILFEFYLC